MPIQLIGTSLVLIAVLLAVGALFLSHRSLLGFLSLASLAAYLFLMVKAGYANGIEVTYLIVGLILLLVEVCIPGFGLVGTAGLVLLSLGLLNTAHDPLSGLATLVAGLVVGLVAGILFVKAGFQSSLLQKSVLDTRLKSEDGFIARKDGADYLGKTGRTLTPLRPSGAIEVDDQRLDAVTDGLFIDRGLRVEIYEVSDGRLLVRPIKEKGPEEGK